MRVREVEQPDGSVALEAWLEPSPAQVDAGAKALHRKQCRAIFGGRQCYVANHYAAWSVDARAVLRAALEVSSFLLDPPS